MTFKVVEIPEILEGRGESANIVTALKANPGKAVEIPVEDRDPNTVRKTVRSAVSNRGLLRDNIYRTRSSADGKTLTIWLEPKEKPVVEEAAQK